MNVNYLLAGLGILATVLIGFWGFRSNLKTRKKISLSFVEKEFIPLFKTIIKNFNSIEIKYKSESITENLVLIKACLVNDGNTDIDKLMIFKPVTISLPKNFKCLEQTITEKSENVNSHIKSMDNEITIFWDLLKTNEYISFDLLVEISTDKDFSVNDIKQNLEYYTIDQRITNLNQINKCVIDLADHKKSSGINLLRKKIIPWSFVVLGLFLILVSLIYSEKRLYINFFTKNQGIETQLKILPQNFQEVKIESNIDSLNFTIPITQLKEKVDINFGIKKNVLSYYYYLVYGLIIFLGGLIMLLLQIKPEREKTIRKLLKKNV